MDAEYDELESLISSENETGQIRYGFQLCFVNDNTQKIRNESGDSKYQRFV